MLSKLFKHEMKATARLLLPLYLVLVVLTVMDRIVLNLHIFKGVFSFLPGSITFFYIMSLISIVIVSFVIIIMRFYKNLMTDEGYLMFTLPVKSHQLINSKLLASLIWTTASILSVIASLLLVFASPEHMRMFLDGLKMVIAEIKAEFGAANTTWFFIEMIILIIVGSISNILMIYVSIAVGQLVHAHKVIGAFGAYIGISVIIQFAVTFLAFIAGVIFPKMYNDLNDATAIPQMLFPIVILMVIACNALFYLVTNYIFNKKLNLE